MPATNSPTTAFIETLQSAAVAVGNGTAMPVGGLASVAIQIVGITTATITFECTVDGTNWVSLLVANVVTGAAVTTATADGIFSAPVGGLAQIRARISAWTSGTITVSANGVLNG